MTYQLVETVTLTGATDIIEFVSLPQDGQDLLIVLNARSSDSGEQVDLRLNNVSSGVYTRLDLKNQARTVISTISSSVPDINFRGAAANAATNETFSSVQVYISNYTSSANKTISIETVIENNDIDHQGIVAGLFADTSPITQFFLRRINFASGTTASIYKIF